MASSTLVQRQNDNSSGDKKDRNAQLRCTHCQLPIPSGPWVWATRGFCCSGCEAAYHLIIGSGLGAYYEMANERRISPAGQESRNERLKWFDDPDFLAKYARRINEKHYSIRLALTGIHCAACVWLLEKLPHLVPGVTSATVNWSKSTIDLEWNSEITQLSQISEVIGNLGYAPYPVSEDSSREAAKRENREQLIRLAIAGAAAGNNMLIAAALYLGMFSGMAGGIEQLLRFASAIIGVFSLAWPGRIFLTGAIAAIRTRTPHMDLPLALGLFVGTLGSVANALRGVGDVYFDSISVLIFVLLLGRWIQSRQQRSAADSIDLLSRLTPRWALRRTGDRLVEVPVDLLRVEDIVQVRAGETIPVDGIVVGGHGSVDESLLTGESVSLTKNVGDQVAAGTQNLHASLEVRATAVGLQTRIGGVATLVEVAARAKPKIVQWADQIGGRFVVIVMLIAGLTLAYWAWFEPAKAIDRAVALLIVACPCALAMATPLAIAVALAQAARRRILIKGGDVLQRLSGRGIVWLDKTGTLTQGQMQMTHWYGDESVKPIVAAIQSNSAHPIAIAMTRELSKSMRDFAKSVPLIADVEQTAAGGIQARHAGKLIQIGNRRFVDGKQVSGLDRFADSVNRLLAEGVTPVFIKVGFEVIAVAGVCDPLRPDAKKSLDEIRRLGWSVGILSGDHPEIVRRVANQLSIPINLAHGDLLPEDKVEVIQNECKHQAVLMIGDGVNDSAALAAASVGIAVRGGAETSIAAAPVYFAREGLRDLVSLVRLARTTMRTIRWNFVASLSYNVVVVALAAAGQINPLLAAILMPISSLTVVAISLMLPRDWADQIQE